MKLMEPQTKLYVMDIIRGSDTGYVVNDNGADSHYAGRSRLPSEERQGFWPGFKN